MCIRDSVNVAVKSGTNDLHGSAWYFNRDRSRTANNYFGNASNQSRPIRTYHRYGGVLSGPVVLPGYSGRDRTFFLVSYERLKDNAVSYTHLRAHETPEHLVCRPLL